MTGDWRAAEDAFDHDVLGRMTLPRLFEDTAARHTGRPAQGYKGGIYDRSLVEEDIVPAAPAGDFAHLSYGEMRDVVRNLAAGFRDLGVEAGDRVGIFAKTRMEWAQTDFALLSAGATVTTGYASRRATQVAHLLGDSGSTGVVVEGEDALDTVLAVEDDLDLEFIVTIDHVPPHRDRDDILSLGELHERGREVYDAETHQSLIDDQSPDDLASLIYTSGTTGKPKGVELTHWNFKANVDQCFRRFGPRPGQDDVPGISEESRVLSFLPLAHVFERLSGNFLMFGVGAHVCYAESPDTLREDFQLVRPTTGSSVPRVYEKLYDAIRSQATESAVRGKIFHWATGVGREYHETDDPGPVLSAKQSVADALVFSKVRDALGGEIEFLISGGGSLSADLCALFHGMGLPVLEGYGLTETSPVLCVNPPGEPKVGTVGPALPDTELRVDEDVASPEQRENADGTAGELLARGPQVFRGYYGLPARTDDAFTELDGEQWFRTGDVVDLRRDGYVQFLERAKQILTLSTGKNVPPGPIEDAFASSAIVEQAMVLGDGQKFVSALVVPAFENLRKLADEEGVELPGDRRAICRDEWVRGQLQTEVERVNQSFERYEQIKKFRVIPEEFTEENDLMTPTLKKKRRNILERFSDEIDLIYEA